MTKRNLHSILSEKFKNGIDYDDATELCIALFCSADWLPEANDLQLSKDSIAQAFRELTIDGLIRKSNFKQDLNTSSINSEHWLQLIETALKSGIFYDKNKIEALLKKPEL
ncbi:hypothetical protein LJR232_003583 [Aquipseudomonas alcaligenes]